MPKASIIVPAFSAAHTISDTLLSLQNQRFYDFEVLVINDGSTDRTCENVAPFLADPRFQLLEQPNRGLAGARNTGIAAANGAYVGFCDADDLWHVDKLDRHIRHLDNAPDVGVSYAGSRLIDGRGEPLGLCQSPRLRNITAAHIFKRNPIGNGSSAVIRQEVFTDIERASHANQRRLWVFDETFRQSEDIECWLRIALTSDWAFEGVPGALTDYRVLRGGLSAQTDRQLASWERMVTKLRPINPGFFARHEATARAYQLRYLARRAVSARAGQAANDYLRRSFQNTWRPLFKEPIKTVTTVCAVTALAGFGRDPMRGLTRIHSKWEG